MNFRWSSCAGLTAALLFSDVPARAEIQPGVEVLPFDATWEWLEIVAATGEQIDPAALVPNFLETWNTPGFTALPFRSDPGPLSYGGLDILNGGTVPAGSALIAPSPGTRATVYCRTAFNLPGNLTNINIEFMVDDGMILYVDGVQWFRQNMAPGATSAFMEFAVVVGQESAISTVSQGLPPLDKGMHTIHVSLHNNSLVSSDLGFLLRLTGDLDVFVPPPELSARASAPSTDGSPRVLLSGKHLDPAVSYLVQFSTDLTTWNTVNTFPAAEARTEFSIDIPATADRRYFRLAK